MPLQPFGGSPCCASAFCDAAAPHGPPLPWHACRTARRRRRLDSLLGLQLQDLAHQVGSARAHVAARLLAISVEYEGGDLQAGGRGERCSG